MVENIKTCLFRRGNKGNYILQWICPKTGKRRSKKTDTDNLAEAEIIEFKKRRELGIGPKRNQRKTNEQRVREYISLVEEEKRNGHQRMKGDLSSGIGNSRTIAARKLRIGLSSAENGVKVLNVADELKKQGKEEEAKEIINELNKSFNRGLAAIGDGASSVKERSIDAFILSALYKLARKLDTRVDLKGGGSHRDECIKILKALSARFEEWRASE